MDWVTLIVGVASALAGGGIWNVISAKISKSKTPYDMLLEMLAEQKKWYQEKNAELEAEKTDSAQKSYIIAQSRICKAKQKDPSIVCPVEEANDARLKSKCSVCKHAGE